MLLMSVDRTQIGANAGKVSHERVRISLAIPLLLLLHMLIGIRLNLLVDIVHVHVAIVALHCVHFL